MASLLKRKKSKSDSKSSKGKKDNSSKASSPKKTNSKKDVTKVVSKQSSKQKSKNKTKDDDISKPKLSSKQQKQANSEAGKKLDWKFGQRADVDDLVARGIVSDEYKTVLKGNKDADAAKKEHKKHDLESKSKIDKVFRHDLRPTADDVEDRGIAPHGSLAGASKQENQYDEWAVKKHDYQKKKAKKKLEQKFGQRMKPDEAVARNIIDQHALDQDYENVETGHETDKKSLAKKLAGKIGQRPDASEVVARGIAQDEKEFFEDYDKLEKRKKKQKKKNMEALNNWKRPSPQEIAKKKISPIDPSQPPTIPNQLQDSKTQTTDDEQESKQSKPKLQYRGSGTRSPRSGAGGGKGNSPVTPSSPKTMAERRRAESNSLRNLNYTISTRVNYRQSYKFDYETCIVLLKDETLKNMGNKGYIYYNSETHKVCNDGTENSPFDQHFLWEITIVNFKQIKKQNGATSPRGNKNKNGKNVMPLFYIKSLGSNGYLRCLNEIIIKKGGKNNDVPQDDGSKFSLLCYDKDVENNNYSFLWTIEKVDGYYTMQMVNPKSHKLKKNQFLTFGKALKIDVDNKSYRLPKKSKLRIFK